MNINPLASNLGHTFGHAIEKLTKNKVQHGDAVSIGTILALKFAITENLIEEKRVKIILLKTRRMLLYYIIIQKILRLGLKYMNAISITRFLS